MRRNNIMKTHSFGKYTLVLCLIAVIGFVAYNALNAPDRRKTGDKIGDAINELPNGVDKAARQLKDRTPADKINDAAKDVGEDL